MSHFATDGGDQRAADGMIVRQEEPPNLEFPFASLNSFITPTDKFYVRNHFPVPQLKATDWRLRVEGAVHQRLELSYEDILKMTARSQVATLECSGNGRGLLVPKVKGVPWGLGAVGNAEWSGVPLAAVLDRAGLRDSALEIILEGADQGELKDDPRPTGVIHFARGLPLEKARAPETLLAYRMNGADLPAFHGFPLRAVVPGWYGVASVKWLTRVIVSDRPFNGFFQSIDYSYFVRRHGLPALTPITEMEVKAEIARPVQGEVVPVNQNYRVHGAAWAGGTEITRVEVSTDAGKTWQSTRLLDKPVPFAWRLWEHTWRAPATASRVTLMARATDQKGRTQPLYRDSDHRNYLISHVLPVDVDVR
jgi:DMSO/TMAO reductase YedYZ molybdopterin-dependent catalytic subunit